MAYDLEEQEQLATLKAWWSKYGNLVTWIVVIGLGSYSAWAGWNLYQRDQSSRASQVFDELQKAVTAKDRTKIQAASIEIKSKFGRTAYAQMAAFSAAKAAVDANELSNAKAELQWIIESGNNDEYKAIAKVRMAGILLDEKAYDEALKQLSGDFPLPLAGLVADRKGDIFVAQSKIEEARIAYQLALEKTDAKNPGHQLIQLKLEAIGGVAKAAA